MMIATLRWRDEFKVEDAVRETFPADVFGKLGHIYGKDKQGRPVTYVRQRPLRRACPRSRSLRYNFYGANKDLDAVFGDVQRFLRYVPRSSFDLASTMTAL